jgi:hypothetical protein
MNEYTLIQFDNGTYGIVHSTKGFVYIQDGIRYLQLDAPAQSVFNFIPFRTLELAQEAMNYIRVTVNNEAAATAQTQYEVV